MSSPTPSSVLSLNPDSSRTWFPYDGRMASVCVVILSLLILLLSILAAVHSFRRRSAPTPRPSPAGNHTPLLPMVVFSEGMRLAGTGVECAICLSEFVSGEKVAVLPKCNHGFHASCIERWLASCCTCPTCRASFRLASPPPEKIHPSPELTSELEV